MFFFSLSFAGRPVNRSLCASDAVICSAQIFGSIVSHRAMAPHQSSSPPRPRQVVQIGVTGHRLNRLSSEASPGLPQQYEQVLKGIAALASRAHDPLLYAPEPPILRIISPLAEGADRIAHKRPRECRFLHFSSPIPHGRAE